MSFNDHLIIINMKSSFTVLLCHHFLSFCFIIKDRAHTQANTARRLGAESSVECPPAIESLYGQFLRERGGLVVEHRDPAFHPITRHHVVSFSKTHELLRVLVNNQEAIAQS